MKLTLIIVLGTCCTEGTDAEINRDVKSAERNRHFQDFDSSRWDLWPLIPVSFYRNDIFILKQFVESSLIKRLNYFNWPVVFRGKRVVLFSQWLCLPCVCVSSSSPKTDTRRSTDSVRCLRNRKGQAFWKKSRNNVLSIQNQPKSMWWIATITAAFAS